ncbi:MAG: DegT/DnrJ/EryC1/StrS family aminotransferase [Flavobacteriales bacterium]
MIKFLDIKKINDRDVVEIKKAVNRVVDSGWFVLGNEVENFESKFAKFHSAKHVIATSNGLDALKLILVAYKALGVFKDGDEILVPANTFIASVLAISDAKLKPVLVEVSEEDFLIDPKAIASKITSNTKGIMNVHLYGQISFSEELKSVINQHNLIHIEDSAQAIGAENFTKKSGTLGDAGAVSFYPGKNLGALGDAGAIITNNDELATVCRTLGNYGSNKKYNHVYQGYNCRMDEMQAAVLSVKLEYINTDNERRQEIAHRYINEISNSRIILPKMPEDPKSHVWHLFVIRTQNRGLLQTFLENNGVQSLIHYPVPIHKQEAYAGNFEESFEITEKLSEEILSIPISPVLTDIEIDRVIEVLNNF